MSHTALFQDEKFAELGKKSDINFESVGLIPIMKLAIKSKSKFFECGEEGSTKESKESFMKEIEDAGGKLFYEYLGETYSLSIWTWQDAAVELTWTGNYVVLKAAALKSELIQRLRQFTRSKLTPPATYGQVYAITSQGGRLSMSSLGDASIALVPYNYTKKVMEDYNFLKEELSSKYPSGRLAILKGKPGTGKTHLVRALLGDVKNALFCLVAPDMVKSLGGPELLPLLMSYHNHTSGPIVLVIEDADKCLVTREDKETDTSIIQSVLNLGDGILGSMLDIRILATTNASEFQMDGALLREGRLSLLSDVGPLDLESAERCYRNLLPNAPKELPPKLLDGEVSLARVYSVARANGWKPAEIKPDESEKHKDEVDYDEDDEDYDE